jgi:hypothetical protein
MACYVGLRVVLAVDSAVIVFACNGVGASGGSIGEKEREKGRPAWYV